MNVRTKLAVVGVVLAAGTVAAFCFRKPVAETQPAAPSATTLPLRDKDAAVAAGSVAAAAAPQGVPLPGASGAVTSANAADSPVGTDFAQAATKPKLTPPQLPPAFSSEVPASAPAPKAVAESAKSPPSLPDLRGSYREAPALEPAPRATVAVSPAPRPIDRPAPWRSHVVVDGDTMSTLAARYLGSAGRFAEILEANRTVLRSADMLPIGTVLRIPPQAAPSTSPFAAPVSLPADEETRFPHLVPIPSGAVTSRAAAE